MNLQPHIERFRKRLAEVEALLSDPKVFDNAQNAQELSREYARLKELVAAGDQLERTISQLEDQVLRCAQESASYPIRIMGPPSSRE